MTEVAERLFVPTVTPQWHVLSEPAPSGICRACIWQASRIVRHSLSRIERRRDFLGSIDQSTDANFYIGGGLFGQNKPATGGFGSAPAATSGGGMFGSSNTGGGFGATNTTAQSNPFGGSTAGASNPFGAAATNTGFGASNTANTGSGFAFGAAGASAPGAATQGTAATPFQPFTEKDGAGSSSTSAYQSITMQQPYQNKSFEELRVEDYLQNRKLPQSGSFGGATGGSTFGGFGQNNAAATPAAGGGLFGAGNTSTTGGFGATNTATTGFGANANTGTGFGASNTGGGLFGAAKPATGGGLFGNNAASSGTATGGFGATSGSGGGLFGNAQAQSNTGSGFGGGFGAGASSSNTSGGGLFGAQNNQTQNKPTFGGFGASNTATTGGFGQANNTAQQPQQGGGLFGAGNTANTGSSLFGAQQNKPAGGGLFGTANTGATNTGGGLFGNNNNTNSQQGTGFGQSTGNTGGGLFGGANNTQNNAGGSLFGNNQAKPATGGLFGASNAGTNTTGGLFGNNNNQQQGANAGGSLFGNNNNQQQQNAGGSLFGGQQNKPAGGTLFGNSTGGGGSLFGNNQTQNQGSMFGGNNANQGSGNSLFGGNNQNQSQGAGSSLFGGNQQQQQQQQNQLTATLTGDPYGNAQLFSSLAAPSPPVGPLATPLSGAKAPQRPRTSLLSSVRGGAPMLGASQSMTPRTRPGYGFSYSSYNSPASGLQNLTPGAAGLLRPTGSLGSSLSGRLSKSFSTSNLRGDAPEGHTLLRTPAAGQSSLLLGNGNGSMGSGSARKLKIDRSLRTDLFGETAPKQKQIEAAKEQDPALRKRVSFDRSAEDNAAKLTTANSPVARHDEDITPTGSPEPKHTNGNGLDSVPEESITPKTSATASPKSKRVVEGGDYWTSPSIKQLQSMSRQQLQNIGTFTVGRHNLGRVEFGREGGVDLSTVPLERICGELVRIEYRHCTVYGDDQEKPPMGEGLNVPSTIHLEQSWPRATRSSGVTPQVAAKAVEKHRRGLSQVKDTEFVEYDASTGIWTFKVEHFTTYGFDESDDENDFEDGTDMMDLQPKIPTPLRNISNGHPEASKPQRSEESEDSDMDSPDLGEPEDTFEFKLSRRSHQDDLNVPGGFDGLDSKSRSTFEHDDARTNELYQDEHNMSGGLGDSYMDDPFIEAGGAVPASNTESRARYNSSVMDDDEESDQEVPGSYRAEPLPPRSILKPSAHMRSFASPEKVAELPWEEQLQRTMSPKKRDRQALKDMQGSLAHAQRDGNSIESPLKKMLFSRSQLGQSHLAVKGAKKNATGFSASTIGAQDFGKSQAFTTGMDLINSLWGQTTKESKARDTTAEV
jgi:nuclear pore complex protein Nup98-Nup96